VKHLPQWKVRGRPIEFDQLRCFVAVAEARSFTRAAAAVHLSQPALSRQIKRLEEELGTVLLKRQVRRVECTPDGLLLLPMARNIVMRVDEAARIIRERVGQSSSQMRIGATGPVLTYLLPGILASFRQRNPSIKVDIKELDDTELEHWTLAGDLDCAILTVWGSMPDVTVEPLLSEEIFAILPDTHPLSARDTVSLSELHRDAFVLPGSSSNMANHLMDACRKAGFEPRVAYRASYLEATKAFIKQGLGIGLMPRMAIDGHSFDGLVTLPLDNNVTRDLCLIYPKDRPQSTATKALAAHIHACIAGRKVPEIRLPVGAL
jgi:LysR family transcriptional regulator, transcription activator of glutamate synthase operon